MSKLFLQLLIVQLFPRKMKPISSFGMNQLEYFQNKRLNVFCLEIILQLSNPSFYMVKAESVVYEWIHHRLPLLSISMQITRIFVQVGREFLFFRRTFLCCSSDADGNAVFRKTLTLENTGNMITTISEIFFGHSKCSGHGFSVPICTDIAIEPHAKYDLQIL